LKRPVDSVGGANILAGLPLPVGVVPKRSDFDSEVSQSVSDKSRIRIRMEAYDPRSLDASAKEIVEQAKRTSARVHGPIPLPTRIERYTVLRSPHIDKKSREQFEMRTHKRIIDISEPTARTVEAINRIQVPAGVFVKIKT